MNQMMPEMDGIQATELIRTLCSGYENTPIIALTANVVNGAEEMLLKHGFNGFLAKPLTIDSLNLCLKKWLPSDLIKVKEVPMNNNTNSTNSAPLKPQDQTIALLRQVDGLDVTSGLKTLANSAPAYLRILRSFVKMVNNEQGKMENFLQQNDLDNFRIAIHGYKSALANIGALSLSDLARELEIASGNMDRATVDQRFPEFQQGLQNLIANLDTALQ